MHATRSSVTEVKTLQATAGVFSAISKSIGFYNAARLMRLIPMMNRAGELEIDQRDAARQLGIDRRTLQRELDELIDVGGLEPPRRTGRANIYALGSNVRECVLRQTDRYRCGPVAASRAPSQYREHAGAVESHTSTEHLHQQAIGVGGQSLGWNDLDEEQQGSARRLQSCGVRRQPAVYAIIVSSDRAWVDHCIAQHQRDPSTRNLRNPAGFLITRLRDREAMHEWHCQQARRAERAAIAAPPPQEQPPDDTDLRAVREMFAQRRSRSLTPPPLTQEKTRCSPSNWPDSLPARAAIQSPTFSGTSQSSPGRTSFTSDAPVAGDAGISAAAMMERSTPSR